MIQENMQQDELANLFSRNLTFNQQAQQATAPSADPPPTDSSPPPASQPITYISQHYTHSAHVTPKANSEPSSSVHVDSSELVAVLLRNSIDPSMLAPSQVTLFQNADEGQKLRLLELWRISPPNYSGQELGMMSETNLQQEETLAKLRYENYQKEAEAAKNQSLWSENEQMMDDGYGRVQASPAVDHILAPPSVENAEPYILSGYESLAKRDYEDGARSLQESNRYNQSVDPVYNKPSGGLWDRTGMQDMENQYGAFAHMREYEAEQRPVMQGYVGVDDMVM